MRDRTLTIYQLLKIASSRQDIGRRINEAIKTYKATLPDIRNSLHAGLSYIIPGLTGVSSGFQRNNFLHGLAKATFLNALNYGLKYPTRTLPIEQLIGRSAINYTGGYLAGRVGRNLRDSVNALFK